MDTETLLLMILVLLIALAISAFQYLYRVQEKSVRTICLLTLRFLSLAILGILLINPSIKKTIYYDEKPDLLLAIDNSKSIALYEQDSLVSAVANRFLSNNQLSEKYDVQLFKFGNNLSPFESLSFQEEHSNLSAVLNTFSELGNQNKMQALLVSDGNQTIGFPFEYQYVRFPVHTIVVGDTIAYDDLEITTINNNKYSYVGNEFPVEVFVNYKGNSTITKKLEVYSNNDLIHTELLTFSKNNNSRNSTFYLKAENPGVNYFSMKIETIENERNIQNNTKYFSVRVIEDASDILILYNTIHPDLGALKNAIESKGKKGVHIEKIQEFESNLANFELVILYQPDFSFIEILNDINSNKTNCFVITGVSTDWSVLNDTFNYINKEGYQVEEDYLPNLNPAFQIFTIDQNQFINYPPLKENFGEVKIDHQHQILLFQKIGTVGLESPMLFILNQQEQKLGFLVGENIFKWRMHDYAENGSFEKFDDFVGQLIQYMASESGNDRLQIDYENSYYMNEDIVIRANYTDGNFQFNPNASLWLSLYDSSEKLLKKIPFVLENKHFKATLADLPEGQYAFEAMVADESEIERGSFTVQPYEIENLFVGPNLNGLKALASNTGGQQYHISDSDALIKGLIDDEAYTSIQKSRIIKTPLIDWTWLLALLIILLGLEWMLRKYFGKI